MFKIFLIILCLIGMGVFYTLRRKKLNELAAEEGRQAIVARDWWSLILTQGIASAVAYSILGLVIFIAAWETSVVNPSGSQIATYDRIYFCSSIQGGRNVALAGECGRQAQITMPGFHLFPFVGVLNEVAYVPMVDVPEGHYAVLTARDGLKLDDGQVAARPWLLGENTFINAKGETVKGDMLDATFFLTDGMGQAGPQSIILTPKRYEINPYLWDVSIDTQADGKPFYKSAALVLHVVVWFGVFWYTRAMRKPALVVVSLVVMIALIVCIDVLFFRDLFWYRLIANVAIFLVFVGIYLKYLE